MGGGYSTEEKELFLANLFSLAQKSGLMPDIDIDVSLTAYSGLNSTAVLQDYTSHLELSVADKGPSLVADLGSTIASLNGVPNAVGLGALIISFILDIAISLIGRDGSVSTLDMMRRVFGEEKASDVRDSMDEYMKRLKMHVWEPLKALEETERWERQLSEQLTRLRNSMLHDNQMSTRSMKHWTNGAAFHVQMLIHAARLKREELTVRATSVSTVIDIYKTDLKNLLEKYKDYKRSHVRFGKATTQCFERKCVSSGCSVKDYEDGHYTVVARVEANCRVSPADYLDYMFKNWNVIKKLNAYFSDTKQNLQELMLQQQTFNV